MIIKTTTELSRREAEKLLKSRLMSFIEHKGKHTYMSCLPNEKIEVTLETIDIIKGNPYTSYIVHGKSAYDHRLTKKQLKIINNVNDDNKGNDEEEYDLDEDIS